MKKIFRLSWVLIAMIMICANITSVSGAVVDIYSTGANNGEIVTADRDTSAKTVLRTGGKQELPAEYSSNDMGLVTPMRNQKTASNCWAYSSLSSLETSMLKNSVPTDWLSVAHLDAWAVGKNNIGWLRTYQGDGYGYTPLGYLTSWSGAIWDSDVPENTDYNNIDLTNNFAKAASVTGAVYVTDSDKETIKNAIYNYGAVTTAFNASLQYFNAGYTATCCPTAVSNIVGHSISVVGWDDNYSRENFREDYRPDSDGAWLIKNSWGSGYNNLGGYFYISYEDYYLFSSAFGECYAYTDIITDYTDKSILQNEKYGATYEFGYLDNNVASTDKITYMNLFDIDENNNSISNVVFETTSIGAKYNIYYVPSFDNNKPSDNKSLWKKLTDGTVEYSGYINARFDEVQVPAGKGAIAIEIDTTDIDSVNQIGVGEWLFSNATGNYIFVPDSSYGESFCYLNGNIYDVMDIYASMNDTIGGTLIIKAIMNKADISTVLGDADLNKLINVKDGTSIQKHLVGIDSLGEQNLSNADFDNDGIVTIKDATKIQKYLSNKS